MTREELNKKAVVKPKTAIEAYDRDPCEDCISREKAIEDVVKRTDMNDDTMDVLIEKLQALPPVQPSRRKGKWIDTQPYYHDVYDKNAYYCSNCHDYYTRDWQEMNFCPNCGADMREE